MIHPQRWLVVITCLGLGLALCSLAAGQLGTCPGAGPAEMMCGELQQDIEVLDIVNRLDLKATQFPGLLKLHADLQKELEKIGPKREALYSQLVPLLREKRTQLMQDKAPGADLEKRIANLLAQIEAMGDDLQRATLSYAGEARKSLTTAQVQILTGADEAFAQAEELLNWIRDLPATSYREEARSNAEELADPALNLSVDAIMKIFESARKMNAAEYAKNKAGLIGKLAPLYMPLPEAADETIVQFLSSPRVGVILLEKAEKAGVKP